MIQRLKNETARLLINFLPKDLFPDTESILPHLEVPKIYDHGHLSFPAFSMAKGLRQPPQKIASDLVQKIKIDPSLISKVESIGGFINFKFSDSYLQSLLFDEVSKNDNQIGYSNYGKGQKSIIDYSSPNVAKPMHVGTFRATIIGQAIRNLAQSQGFEVISVNHLGDWGSQFGKLAWAYLEWGQNIDLNENPIEKLNSLYVRFHDESKKNPSLEEFGAATFKRLEEGDPEIVKTWRMIVDLSVKEFQRLYETMDIKFDYFLGESFYTDKMNFVINELREQNLLKQSEGAHVVFFDENLKIPPCIILKSDGATMYATRDLAAAIYRHDVMKADELIYVVGQSQALHFKQVFKVLEMLGHQWSHRCHHVGFGLYRFKEGKMATREGRVILFEDMIRMSRDLVTKMIHLKNPTLENKEDTISKVSMGAIIFNDLINDRIKDIEFDWDRALSLDGDSGPFIQYTAVRCKSLLRKFGKEPQFDSNLVLKDPVEQKLIFTLLKYSDTLTSSYKNLKPNILAQYLLEVCGDFSTFYHHSRILSDDIQITNSRMALVISTEKILCSGLGILNIKVPEMM